MKFLCLLHVGDILLLFLLHLNGLGNMCYQYRPGDASGGWTHFPVGSVSSDLRKVTQQLIFIERRECCSLHEFLQCVRERVRLCERRGEWASARAFFPTRESGKRSMFSRGEFVFAQENINKVGRTERCYDLRQNSRRTKIDEPCFFPEPGTERKNDTTAMTSSSCDSQLNIFLRAKHLESTYICGTEEHLDAFRGSRRRGHIGLSCRRKSRSIGLLSPAIE